jgi:hypothetical protein
VISKPQAKPSPAPRKKPKKKSNKIAAAQRHQNFIILRFTTPGDHVTLPAKKIVQQQSGRIKMSHPSDPSRIEQTKNPLSVPDAFAAAGGADQPKGTQPIERSPRATEPSRLAVPAVTHDKAYQNYVDAEAARRAGQKPQNGVSDAPNPESQSPAAGGQGRGRF